MILQKNLNLIALGGGREVLPEAGNVKWKVIRINGQ